MTPRKPEIRTRAEHCISRRDIDPDALKVLYRLARKGFTAYLVGGGVRDLLLGRHPKDFDVSTSAHPNEIRGAFRNAFLIGRRFRLAHIRYGKKVIETATFRRQPETDIDPNDPEADLLQKEDNTFGTPEEDALRRDFTINGLFYDIETFRVIDYVGGLKDLENKSIRTIGEPEIRFREDPVRMLRAVRFASRLGFTIEKTAYDAILAHHSDIQKCSSARLTEEIYKLFAYQSGEAAFRLLHETGLLEDLFPQLHTFVEEDEKNASALWAYLHALDEGDTMLGENTQPLFFGALLLPYLLHKQGDGFLQRSGPVNQTAIREAVSDIREALHIPRRVIDCMIRLLSTQYRFSKSNQKRFSRSRFVSQEYFLEALALYEIHLRATGQDLALAQEWRNLYLEKRENGDDTPQQEDTQEEESSTRSGRNGRRRNRRKKKSRTNDATQQTDAETINTNTTPEAPTEETEESTDISTEEATKRPRRKRSRGGRRRRKKTDGSEQQDTPAENPTQPENTSDSAEETPTGTSSEPKTDGLGEQKKDKSAYKENNKRKASDPKKQAKKSSPTPPVEKFEENASAPHWMEEI